jgi:hypothetical protein
LSPTTPPNIVYPLVIESRFSVYHSLLSLVNKQFVFVSFYAREKRNWSITKFETPPYKKELAIPHEKCHLLLVMGFLVNKITNLPSNITYRQQFALTSE